MMRQIHNLPILTATSIVLLSLPVGAHAEVDFERDIAPIFAENCLDCHGPDKQKGELRLDQRAIMLRGGDSGLATIVPGDTEKSYLLELVKHLESGMEMPPKGDPLSDDQIALLETWIDEGAQWPGQMDTKIELTSDLWSLQPVQRPDIPDIPDAATPIDAFLLEKLNAENLTYNEPADPRDLIRRVSILLTGLPPTPEEVNHFIAASKDNPNAAYTELVDKLIASPHFGERWAQHWLDVIRWAETNGSEANLYRKNAWLYRDYLIRAFNEDIPYDQFVTEQLAGDQLGAGEATGFLVAGPHVPAATVGREPAAIRQARADRMDEIMQTVGASLLGMTVSCARCHNHKFDPISIQDYYSLTAVFQGVEFGGRHPELAPDHPRKKRAEELYPAMFKERKVLREGTGQWLEDWGGFHDFAFPTTETKALRIEFSKPNVGVDELDVYGPDNYKKNLARASYGTKLKTDDTLTKKGNDLWKANDGKFGTMAWRTQAPQGSNKKAWVEIHFPNVEKVNRFRFSANREYYFETDYLLINSPRLPGFKVSALQSDGTWKQLGDTMQAGQLINKNLKLKNASNELHRLIGTLAEEGPRHSFVGQFIEPVKTHVLHRGSPENPRDEVPPAGFAILKGDLGLDTATPDPKRRMTFANWLTRPAHPLTARVMVNRVWHHLFGLGLVPTTSDFGVAGAPPSHPELLDYLASEFTNPENSEATPWSVKDLIRSLVLTDAFKQSSAPREDGLQADAGASLLWRFPPRRVEAEVIRDGILQASGKLNPSLGGRSYRIHNTKKTYAQWEVVDNHGDETWRRMIYQERMRRVDDRIFTAFDFPDCGQVRAKRPVSTTPLQALNLMNSDFVVAQSNFIAQRAQKEASDKSPKAQISRAFQLLLGRNPDDAELAACITVHKTSGLTTVCRTLINSNEFAFLP
ncbi:MAG: PSD1 and planctomycete cytochrome C domain-containing protein [Verrucomicrobiota bacterium]